MRNVPINWTTLVLFGPVFVVMFVVSFAWPQARVPVLTLVCAAAIVALVFGLVRFRDRKDDQK